jgi:hypothetical protein
MDILAFKKYIEERKKIEKDFGDIKPLEEKYLKYKEVKDKTNNYAREWHKTRMETDEEYKEKRKQYNKQSYERLKQKKEKVKSNDEDEPIEPIKKQSSRTNKKKVEKVEKEIIINIEENKKVEKEELEEPMPVRNFIGLGI